jgi:hypothetical protein
MASPLRFGSSRFAGEGFSLNAQHRSHNRSSGLPEKARGTFLFTACNAAAIALNGDEVSKISREIEDQAVAAPRNISQNLRPATFFTATAK